ncbi:MAG: hypothetical protein ABFQ53_03985 [Patescibacteria group bacterium]
MSKKLTKVEIVEPRGFKNKKIILSFSNGETKEFVVNHSTAEHNKGDTVSAITHLLFSKEI